MALTDQHTGDQLSVPCSVYNFEQLADIYNRARVDYIVPMPMNAKRMMEYVRDYDIDLDGSAVALTDTQQECGVIMMGLREQRAWVTRLGVIPENRKHGLGQFLMELLLQNAQERKVHRVQLEVIRGNIPAFNLFQKLGFETVRDLLVIRRPPGMPTHRLAPVDATVTEIAPPDILSYLAQRSPAEPAWTEETASFRHLEGLQGLELTLPSGEVGWIVFQKTTFQLSHFVFSPQSSDEMALALLYTVHQRHPKQDTKIENVPTADRIWHIYQQLGYLEVFSRIEMYLNYST